MVTMTEAPRQRRPRADAGQPWVTERDALGMSWVVEMYGMPFDLLHRRLGSSQQAIRNVIQRWRKAGWVESGRFGDRVWLWATRDGIERFGRHPYQERPPSQARIEHTQAVIETRLMFERQYGADQEWTSERALRYELGARVGSAAQRRHVPDAVVEWIEEKTGTPMRLRAAVEVELTPKTVERAREIVRRLFAEEESYARVLYVVSRQARPLMERVVEQLQQEMPVRASRIVLIDFEEGT